MTPRSLGDKHEWLIFPTLDTAPKNTGRGEAKPTWTNNLIKNSK